jgi:Fe-S cluster biosynthesis and repair protein YggX
MSSRSVILQDYCDAETCPSDTRLAGLRSGATVRDLCRTNPIYYNEEDKERALSTMAHMVFCVRNKREMEGLDEPPFDSEFGQKIYKNVSKAAWGEWVERQKMLLNEYRLQPWTPQAQQFLVEQMEEFFFGTGSALPSEYVPPSQ